jgi:tRNA 2-thiouridine synthesizing protein A
MAEKQPVKTLDCVGLYCPQPLFQTRQGIDSVGIGEILEVLADDPAAEEDIKRFCKRTGHTVISIESNNGILRFLIKRNK